MRAASFDSGVGQDRTHICGYERTLYPEANCPLSVNLIVTNRCNYRCLFCFGRLKSFGGIIDDSRILDIPGLLYEAGCRKITFEGGEPFLHPEISRLVEVAKDAGLTTGIVTNGSLVTYPRLARMSSTLDWLGLSVDSAKEEIELRLGRGNGGHVAHARKVADWTHELGIGLKVNAVITRLNCREDMREFATSLRPKRFKALQVLKIAGENDDSYDALSISRRDFDSFVKRHLDLNAAGIQFVSEREEDMIGSYVMMTPNGRFISNSKGFYRIGAKNVFRHGVRASFEEAEWDIGKFLKRGGYYAW